MLIDLLSRDNYCSFNIKLASILGLHTAIYLNELLNINEKALRKDKVSDNFFIIDRGYIKSRTTLEEEEQLEIDSSLASMGIIQVGNDSNSLTLNLTVLTSLVSAEPTMTADLEKLMKNMSKPKKRTKKEAIADNLKSNIIVENAELRDAYHDWIDAVIAKNGWMSAKAVRLGQATIDAYCNHNLDLALYLLGIASIHGDREIKWTIERYERDYKLSYHLPQTSPEAKIATLSEEIF